jgi:hypothetical protein
VHYCGFVGADGSAAAEGSCDPATNQVFFSSAQQSTYGMSALNAIDDSLETRQGCQGCIWTGDLGAVYKLAEIRIFWESAKSGVCKSYSMHSKNKCEGSIGIEVSEDGATWVSFRGKYPDWPTIPEIDVSGGLNKARYMASYYEFVLGRYVRVISLDETAGWWSMWEIEAYGCKPGTSASFQFGEKLDAACLKGDTCTDCLNLEDCKEYCDSCGTCEGFDFVSIADPKCTMKKGVVATGGFRAAELTPYSGAEYFVNERAAGCSAAEETYSDPGAFLEACEDDPLFTLFGHACAAFAGNELPFNEGTRCDGLVAASEARGAACWDQLGDEGACGGRFPGKRKHTDADQAALLAHCTNKAV